MEKAIYDATAVKYFFKNPTKCRIFCLCLWRNFEVAWRCAALQSVQIKAQIPLAAYCQSACYLLGGLSVGT